MIVLGIDVAARVDRTAAAFLDDWTLAEIALLRPPVKYPEVLAFCGSAADRADVTLLDATGVGAAVLDMLLPDHPELIGVRFTAGDEIKAAGPIWTAGKAALVQTLRAGLSTGKVKLALPPEQREMLREEMAAFRLVPGKRPGSWKYEAAQGAHDDVLMACCLAVIGAALVPKAKARRA